MITINLMLVFKIICLLIQITFIVSFIISTFKSGANSFIVIIVGFLAFALPFTYILIN